MLLGREATNKQTVSTPFNGKDLFNQIEHYSVRCVADTPSWSMCATRVRSASTSGRVTGLKQPYKYAHHHSLFVGCLTSQQRASASKGRIFSDNFMCCHTEIEVVDQAFCLTQSQYTETGPTSPSVNPIMPGAWQGSHWSANFKSLV